MERDQSRNGAAMHGDAVVECRHVTKYFGGVQALGDASLSLHSGKVVCLVGDNGAGKSTLTKVISGQLRPDAGELLIDGKVQSRLTSRSALDLGIAVVPQALSLCDNLNAAQNVMLGAEPVKFKIGPFHVIDRKRERTESFARIEEIGVQLNKHHASVRRLSGGQRQAVAIARAMVRGTKAVIFDEPTAALGVHQTEATLDLIRQVAARNIAVLVITHSLADVMSVGDRIVGLRHGNTIYDKPIEEATEDEVAAAMGLRVHT